jgi:uncharacterized radical SAM superfamily Fe-S cluster-containing enzyme
MSDGLPLRDHVLLGATQSLCPECLALVPAKILDRGGRVYFRKHCPTHGLREDFVCSDVTWYDRMEFSLPGKVPHAFGVEPRRGCPYDCGLCTEHEQHTCVGLLEVTSSCNLNCPMCFASSGPGGEHLSFDECRAAIDRLVAVEGRPEVLQLSGGEPTLHPDFARILDYAVAQPIDLVMVNTNGLRLAHDPELVDRLAAHGPRVEVYFQLDGFTERSSTALRGESLVATKMKALDALGRRGIKTTLVATLHPDVNDDQIGPLVRFGLDRPWITGISFQPATYSGRHTLPEDLERRITFPDVVRAIVAQTGGLFREDDFLPLPCAHPNCHTLTYAYRGAGGAVVPLTRFVDARNHLELLANGILFTRNRARKLIENYLAGLGCCGHDRGAGTPDANTPEARAGAEFFARALGETLGSADVFRITITSFLDAFNFDVRRLMKCCIHHVLPGGHIIPFCAYNVLYREGHAALPALRQAGANGLAVANGSVPAPVVPPS